MNRNQEPLLKIVETGLSGIVRDRLQSEVPPGFNELLLLRPSDIWMMKKHEPWQLWRLWWWIVDLNKEK
jgi:hypothetical protein